MQLLLCITVLVAVVSGVASRNPVHSSQRHRGQYYARPQNNAISSYRPTYGRNVLCRYGNFKRDCCYGFERNPQGTCTPICEEPCVNGLCVGPGRCKCNEGWTGDFCEKDFNECGVRPCSHRCMNTPGSYRCYCDHGFILLADGKTCSRDDRCYSTRCAFGCVQYSDGFNCFCPEGLRLTADGLGCEDIDECEEDLANCPTGRRCTNTYGNYLCLCPKGFKFQHVQGKLTCVDDDECAANRDKCHANAYCENLSGGYRCVCSPGFIGTGTQCVRLGSKTCDHSPCAEGVTCTKVQHDINNIDYSVDEVNRFRCGPCPPGQSGDGIDCVASNVDVTILVVEQTGGTPVPDVKIRTYDIRGGQGSQKMAFTGINGVAKVPLPSDAEVIVVASKQGSPTSSTTYNVRRNENNLVTLTLGNYNDGVAFIYPTPMTRTFAFADPNGELQVQIPQGGLNVTDGTTVNLNVRTVDVSDPATVGNVPELAALTATGSEPNKLEAIAVAEIALTERDTNEPIDLTEAATIRIPISDRFGEVSPGDIVPAWYFDEAIGLWVSEGAGRVEDDGMGGLVWVYQAEHFTWWAAANIWPGMQLVKIKTCFTEDCSSVKPNTGIAVFGVDYMYYAAMSTNQNGYTFTFLKTDAPIRVIDLCSSEHAEYVITSDITEIIYKVPDTANHGCVDPGDVENGVRQGEDFSYGGEVTYYCNPDYTRHGSSQRICTACGSWSGYQPYCELEDFVSSSSYTSSSVKDPESTSPSIDVKSTSMFNVPNEMEGSGDQI